LPVYSVYNALIGPFMFMVLDKINDWLKPIKPNPYKGIIE
ncbi:uncharacterized protein METZ01_LOCUS303269, partial [marine metagenome]